MVSHCRHDGLARYLAERHVGDGYVSPDGSITMVFDGRYRVACLVLSNGELLLEARICDLAADAAARRSLLEELLLQTGRTLERHAEWMSITQDRQTLVLQQTLPAQAPLMDVERLLEDFINALANWRRLAGVL